MGCCNTIIEDDFTIQGADFQSATQYANTFLYGRYRLYLNGVRKLIEGTDWEYIQPNQKGGFNILIAGFSPIGSFVCGEFY